MSRPRVGFLGLGWIGRHRLEAVRASGAVTVAALADASETARAQAAALAPEAEVVAEDLPALLACGLDGLVIATPSALHAAQTVAALDAGLAVFCQKPLGRTAAEAEAAVAAARRADRLLAVDMSYRHCVATQPLRRLAQSGELGRVFAGEFTFHNAYGPDKAWYRDPRLAGGGCVADLGVHLVDLALWALSFPEIVAVESRLYAGGRRLPPDPAEVEDFALATLETADGASLRIACSWNLAAGCDCVIGASLFGTEGGVTLANDGGYYDFTATRLRGTAREVLAQPPDAWGGRAAADWARRLAAGEGFDPAAEELATVARVVDRIYGRVTSR